MKKIDLGQTVAILANLGVIAGIIFLAVEINQNNKLLRAEAIGTGLDTRIARQENMLAGVDLAALLQRNATQETLSPEDLMRMEASKNRSLLGWQKDYFLYQEGILPEEYLRANFPVMRAALGDRAGVLSGRDYWEEWSARSSAPDFRAFAEQCLFSECETIPR